MSCSSPIRAVTALPWPGEPLVTRDPSARAHHLAPQRAWTPSKPKLTQKGEGLVHWFLAEGKKGR